MSEERQQYPLAVHLTARDVARSVAFYRDVLGFTLKESWPSPDAPQWANLLLDGQSVMVGANPDVERIDCMEGATDAHKAAWRARAEEFTGNRPGAGLTVYLRVPDVDAAYAQVVERGGAPLTEPTDQFYGQRDFPVRDPDGYWLVFYAPISMSSCQSCGMPLPGAEPGQMFCGHCVDERGNLRPFEVVLAGAVEGYFVAQLGLPRDRAEAAAREHLLAQPAWKHAGV